MAKVRTDWEDLRNQIEAWLVAKKISTVTAHLVANDLTSRTRGNRLPLPDQKGISHDLLAEINALAAGAAMAIRAARAG